MNAAEPKFETRFERRFRQERRASQKLRAEHKRAMKARGLPVLVIPLVILGVVVGVPLIGFVIPVGLLNFVIVRNVGPTFALALSGLISTAFSLIFAGHLLFRLQRSREVSVGSHLPISDAETLQSIWAALAVSYFMVGYLAALLHGVVAYRTNLDWTGWLLAISLGVLQGAVVVAV